MNRVILLLVDGLRADVAEAALERGDLPHLQRLVAGGGASRAVTAFPSTTSVSYLPFLTGCLPGRCNVPSIRWLDRRTYGGRWWADRAQVRSYCGYQAGMLDADIAPDVRTMFELVPESAAFFTMITRGLTPDRDPAQGARKFWGAVSHYLLWHQPGDDVVARHLLRRVEQDPDWRFLFAQFPAVDGYTHQTSPTSAKVLTALRHVDRRIGELVALLGRRGIREQTLILVVSDHGATPVHEHLDLATWLRERGVPTLAHPELWRAAPRAAVMVAGNGSAMIYARPGQPRPDRWPLSRLRQADAFGSRTDLIGDLVRERGVAFVAGEDEAGGLRVAAASGEARLTTLGPTLWYQPLTGDPLDVGGDFTLDRRAWLRASFDGAYPDAVVQLDDQFRSPRTGDLVVVAREGYDFRDRWEVPEHRAGHGSLIRSHMHTPLWSSRPVPPVRFRTVDLFPAMLEWLGEPIPPGLDGDLVWAPGAAARPGALTTGPTPGA